MIDEFISRPWPDLVLFYLAGGVVTIIACWIYDRVLLALQGYYDENPVTTFGYLLQVVLWPIVLIGRTVALPWQLWIAYEARRSN